MKAYIDITLLPGDDIGLHFLWEKVYQQIHIALVENKTRAGFAPVAVTFPEFSMEQHRLGRKLRVLASTEDILEQMDIKGWLVRLSDYVHITSIRAVPEKVRGYVRYQRQNPKSSVERLARRAARKHGITFEQAMEERKNMTPQYTKAPYIWMKSQSSQRRFRLFIEEVIEAREKEPVQQAVEISFYGLTRKGFLPLF